MERAECVHGTPFRYECEECLDIECQHGIDGRKECEACKNQESDIDGSRR